MNDKIELTARNFTITPDLREYAYKRLNKIINHGKKITSIHLVFHEEKNNQHLIDGNMHIPGHTLHASTNKSDIFAAIDDISDKLHSQLIKIIHK